MSPSTMPAISAPNSRAMSSARTSESSTTSCSSAAAMVVVSSSCSARIWATAMLWETKSSPDIRFWPRWADALKRRARSISSRSSRSACRSSTADERRERARAGSRSRVLLRETETACPWTDRYRRRRHRVAPPLVGCPPTRRCRSRQPDAVRALTYDGEKCSGRQRATRQGPGGPGHIVPRVPSLSAYGC